jgi:hypothetical protein
VLALPTGPTKLTTLFGTALPFDNLADFIPLLDATSAKAIKRHTAALHGQAGRTFDPRKNGELRSSVEDQL